MKCTSVSNQINFSSEKVLVRKTHNRSTTHNRPTGDNSAACIPSRDVRPSSDVPSGYVTEKQNKRQNPRYRGTGTALPQQ